MKRRVTIGVDERLLTRLATTYAGLEKTPAGELLALISRALDPASRPATCPTCEEALGCDRCFGTGRQVLCKIDVASTTTGRAVVQVWQGAPGTMQVVALTAPDRDLADVTVDAWLSCLQNGGLIINDRRAR